MIKNNNGMYICEKCGGEMILDESSLYTSLPPQVRYICKECGHDEFMFACSSEHHKIKGDF